MGKIPAEMAAAYVQGMLRVTTDLKTGKEIGKTLDQIIDWQDRSVKAFCTMTGVNHEEALSEFNKRDAATPLAKFAAKILGKI